MCICHLLETSPPGFEPNYGSFSGSFCIAARMTPKLVGNHSFVPPFSESFWTYYIFEPTCFVVCHHSHGSEIEWMHTHFYWSYHLCCHTQIHSFSDLLKLRGMMILECNYIYNLTQVPEEMYSSSEHLQEHQLQYLSYLYQQVCKMVDTILITYLQWLWSVKNTHSGTQFTAELSCHSCTITKESPWAVCLACIKWGVGILLMPYT